MSGIDDVVYTSDAALNLHPSHLFFSFRSYVLSLGFVFSLQVLGANCSMRIYDMVSASGATCDPHVVGRFTCTESNGRET
jgi:hypothetical protein